MKYATKYNKSYRNSLSKQAGYLGLLKAAEMFNSSIGTRFSTYAVYWIKQSISREIFDNGFTIRMPVYIMEKMSRVVKLDIEYDMRGLSFKQRVALIAEDLDLSVSKVTELLSLNNRFRICASLNAPIGEDKETELEDLVEDMKDSYLEDVVTHNSLSEELDKILQTLTDREEEIIRYRCGLIDGRPWTLEEIGNIYHVTRERIRQIETTALRKLRHPIRSNRIAEYLCS